jgi:hypothetical protein
LAANVPYCVSMCLYGFALWGQGRVHPAGLPVVDEDVPGA